MSVQHGVHTRCPALVRIHDDRLYRYRVYSITQKEDFQLTKHTVDSTGIHATIQTVCTGKETSSLFVSGEPPHSPCSRRTDGRNSTVYCSLKKRYRYRSEVENTTTTCCHVAVLKLRPTPGCACARGVFVLQSTQSQSRTRSLHESVGYHLNLKVN